MARILDRLEGAAKWVTDPKQILTAAGFMLGGGPVGAGVGRTIGGMIPQPWGDRKSSFEGSGDIGRFAGDFASGYNVGTIGQQVPGIRNLEGRAAVDKLSSAFGGGDAMSAVAPPPGGPSTGVSPQFANVPAGNRYWATHTDAMPTGGPVGMTEAGGGSGVGDAYRYFTEGPRTPVFQQAPGDLTQGGASPSSYEQMRALDPGSVVRRSELQERYRPFQAGLDRQLPQAPGFTSYEQMRALDPGSVVRRSEFQGGASPFQNTAPLQFQGGVSPFQNTAPLQSQGGGVSPFQNAAPLQSQGGGPNPFQIGLDRQLPQVPPSTINTRAGEFTNRFKPEVSGDGGLLGDLGLGDLGPLERMYMVSQLASGLGTAFGGPENIGPAPSSWGPRPSFRYEGFDDWRSRRNI